MNYAQKQIQNKKDAFLIEKQIIGTIYNKSDFALLVIEKLKDFWFLNQETKELYLIIKKATLNKEDALSEIQRKGYQKLWIECIDVYVYGLEQAFSLVEKLKDIWLNYTTQETIQRYSEKEIKEAITEISYLWSDLTDITNNQEFERNDVQYMIDLFNEESNEYKQKKKDGRKFIGYETGFSSIDNNIDGLRNGHLIIIGGYTSAGKTQFALNIVKNLINQQVKVSIYSLEMSKVDIFKRMLGIMSGKNGTALLKDTNDQHIDLKNKTIDDIKKSDIRVHTEKNNINDILTSMIIEKQTQGTQVFVIDYAQLVQGGGKQIFDDMRTLAIKLQNFCRSQNIPVILLSQISNESAKSSDSAMIGFKGAGELGASADMAIELSNGEDSKEDKDRKIANGEIIKIKVNIKKNRHGKITNDIVYFQPISGQFFDEDPEF
ncbi:MAG: hypothetical protein RLZZ546_2154 [Bacteroidota bacterium]|jgi:replicative DNA helicase